LLQELEEPLDSSLSSLLEDLVLRLSDSLFLVLSHLLINELFSHFVAPGFLSGRSSVIDLSLTVEDLRVEVDLSDILALALVPFFIYVQHFFKEVHILLEE
jgi:hypothetical protein